MEEASIRKAQETRDKAQEGRGISCELATGNWQTEFVELRIAGLFSFVTFRPTVSV